MQYMGSIFSGTHRVWILIAVITIVAAGIAGYAVYQSNGSGELSRGRAEPPRQEDAPDRELRVEADTSVLEDTKNLNVRVTMYNRSRHDLDVTFSDSCTRPDLFVNGEYVAGSRGGACAQVITDITIAAGKSRTWEFRVPARVFTQEENRLIATWRDYESVPLKIRKDTE